MNKVFVGGKIALFIQVLWDEKVSEIKLTATLYNCRTSFIMKYYCCRTNTLTLSKLSHEA